MIYKGKEDLKYVLCYTRKPQENLIYSEKLAYSMHLAYSEDGVGFQELNHNSGVLFAKATENDNGSLNAKSLKNPYIFYLKNGTFGVVAIRTGADGENDEESKGRVLLFTSADLLKYKEIGLIDLKVDTYVNDITCEYDDQKKLYVILWSDENGNYYKNLITDIENLTSTSMPEKAEAFILEQVRTGIEGITPRNVIGISMEVAHHLICKLIVPTNVQIKVPESVNITSEKELKAVKAIAIYSDGTTATKNVDWDLPEIDWNKSGNYRITGKVHQDHYEFPIATDRADPCIGKWKG